jgi:uncharacterized protein (TIGR02147 family)
VDPIQTDQLLASIPIRKRPMPKSLIENLIHENSSTQDDGRMQLDSDEFNLISDWHCFAILSLSRTEDFEGETEWIADRIGISSLDAKKSVETLLRLNLLKGESPHLHYAGNDVKTTTDISDVAIKRYHQKALEQAQSALFELPVEDREFSSSVLTFDPSRMDEVKKIIRKMRSDLVHLMESTPKKEVYRFSVQFMPLSRRANIKTKTKEKRK